MDLQAEAFVVCKEATLDERRVRSLIGVFREFGVERFPGALYDCILWGEIGGFRKNAELTFLFEYFDPDQVEPVCLCRDTRRFVAPPDMGHAYELIVPLDDMPLPGPGEYRLQIFHGEKLLGMRRLFAEQLPQGSFDEGSEHE